MAVKKGRPAAKRDEQCATQVQALSQYGVPQENIAAVIGVCVETMQKLYSNELAKGKARANTQIGKRLFDKAMEGDTAALIFWAKTQMGWRENKENDFDKTENILKHIETIADKIYNPRSSRNLEDFE